MRNDAVCFCLLALSACVADHPQRPSSELKEPPGSYTCGICQCPAVVLPDGAIVLPSYYETVPIDGGPVNCPESWSGCSFTEETAWCLADGGVCPLSVCGGP